MWRTDTAGRKTAVGPALGFWLAAWAIFSASAIAGANPDDWYALYIGGNKVGYLHVGSTNLKHGGEEYVRVNYEMVLNFRRDNDSVTVTQRYGTIETPDGSVLKLDSRALTGQEEMRAFGTVADGEMDFGFEVGGKTVKKRIPWADDVRGPYGAELSLERAPMKPGETRSVKVFIPQLNEICIDELTAKRKEEVVIGGRKENLLRVEVKGKKLDGKRQTLLDQTIWVDEQGKIGKSFTDAFGGFTSVRTTREFAKAPNSNKPLDINKQTFIQVARKLPDQDRLTLAVYRFRMRDGNPSELFPSDGRQSVKSESAHAATLTVRATGPNDGEAGPEKPAAEYSRANPMIDSEDPIVIGRAREATANATSPWDKATAIEQWVFKHMEEKNFKTAFAPATEVARRLSGDCTEHAVLTAAMCRASGIPCRIATGLIYVDTKVGFGFHMWNEVYVNRRWTAMDAAFGQTVADPTHIKLSDTSMDGVSPFEGFIGVEQVANRLAIDVLEAR